MTAKSAAPASFGGFGDAATTLLRDLQTNNDKAWYEAHRDRFESEVRAPMLALVAELEGLFGPGKVFRQHRDVRFSKDKRPYKEWVAATVGGGVHEATRYLQLGPTELFVAAGAYQFDRERLTAYRRAVDARTSGEALQAILDDLAAKGYEIGGKTLARGPRDVRPDHPRIELLKHTGVTLARRTPVGPWLRDADAVMERVLVVFGDAEPLIAWSREHLA
jgi:uncharacterized protein (TIGR02453 family)